MNWGLCKHPEKRLLYPNTHFSHIHFFGHKYFSNGYLSLVIADILRFEKSEDKRFTQTTAGQIGKCREKEIPDKKIAENSMAVECAMMCSADEKSLNPAEVRVQ